MGNREVGATSAPGTRLTRETLTVEGVAARLEHRLHWADNDQEQLAAGCAFAVESRLAAVLCRPEHVGLAAGHVADSEVDVVTALGFHDPASPKHSPDELAAEAAELTAEGAAEVALIAAPAAMPDACVELLVDQVHAVTEALSAHSGRVRVLLNSTGMLDEEVSSACRAVAGAGAALVQGGSFRGDRTSISRIETMRAALPREVLLKWTHPVRSIESLLLCVALGVDRFNGEPAELLTSADRHSKTGPLTIPLAGLDF